MSKQKELKEDLRILLIAYELCYLTDHVNEEEEYFYIEEKPILNKHDLSIIFQKYQGWGFGSINNKIRKKTEELINL